MFEGEFHKKWCLGGKLMGLPIGANHRQLSTCLCISSNFLNTKEGYKRIGCNTEKVFYGVVVGTQSVTKSGGCNTEKVFYGWDLTVLCSFFCICMRWQKRGIVQ
jgi:hypothetical protein